VIAAWAITNSKFRRQDVLISLIDLPFSDEPVDIRASLRAAVRRAGIFRGPGCRRTDIQVVVSLCRALPLANHLRLTFPFVAGA